MNIILFINIFCTGVVFVCSVILITYGSKVLSTIFHGLFWFVAFLYLITLNLDRAGITGVFNVSNYIHFFLPVFYALFLAVMVKKKFKIIFLLFLMVPIPFILYSYFYLDIVSLFYHLISWPVLIFITIYIQSKKNIKEREKKHVGIKKNLIYITANVLAVFPFLVINIFYIFILKKDLVIEEILPPCLAIVVLFILIYSYQSDLINMNHDYFANINFLKISNVNEKKTIIEKISASLVHEIKNPITAVQSLSQQLLNNRKNISEKKIDEYLKLINEELKKTKNLTDSFLSAFKKGSKKKDRINIKEIIESIYSLLKFELIKENIILDIDNCLKDVYVDFNKYNLRQVFLNLIYNAIEAEAKKIEFTCKFDKEFINIYINDNGKGIKKESISYLFSPFFTTKIDGTGMGLVISREIMHDNKGNLVLVNSDENNTVFCVSIKK